MDKYRLVINPPVCFGKIAENYCDICSTRCKSCVACVIWQLGTMLREGNIPTPEKNQTTEQ